MDNRLINKDKDKDKDKRVNQFHLKLRRAYRLSFCNKRLRKALTVSDESKIRRLKRRIKIHVEGYYASTSIIMLILETWKYIQRNVLF